MPIVWTRDPAALETDPLALLIGMVLDQQVKMEKAFAGPYDLERRLGHLDTRKIPAMDPDKLDAVFRERPALQRFPGQHGPARPGDAPGNRRGLRRPGGVGLERRWRRRRPCRGSRSCRDLAT